MDKVVKAFNKGYRITETGKIITPTGNSLKERISNTGTGYQVFGMRHYGKVVNVPFHRLQAFQKYGNKLFEEGVVVRHLNGNSMDNSWDNISIGTHQENSLDVEPAIRLANSLHATSFVRKYDKEEVRKFHSENGNSYKNTMENFDISSKGTLHFILNK